MTADADIWSTHRGSTYPWEPQRGLADPTFGALARHAASVPPLLAEALHTANRTLAAVNDLVDLMEEGADLIHDLKDLVARLEPIVALGQEAAAKVDPDELIARVERVEQALLNTERASLNLDKSIEGSIESLPNVLSRRAKKESQKIDPTRPPHAH